MLMNIPALINPAGFRLQIMQFFHRRPHFLINFFKRPLSPASLAQTLDSFAFVRTA